VKYWKLLGIAGAVCVVLLGAANVWADDAAKCVKLSEAKQYTQAFPVCRKAAEQGDTLAQSNLDPLVKSHPKQAKACLVCLA